jgi:hypothetical protein
LLFTRRFDVTRLGSARLIITQNISGHFPRDVLVLLKEESVEAENGTILL